MKYSIIIPSYKNLELTKKCLESLCKNTDGDYEIIVVDDNSGDGTAEYLGTQKNKIKLYINKENRGFAKNCNYGAKKSNGDVYIFLNNDTEVHPGWLKAIEDVFRCESEIGAVGVKLLFPDGTIQHAGVVISEDKVPRHIYYQAKSEDPRVNKQREYQAVTAACIAIPRVVFEKLSGFDESYRNGLEDVDLCLRIKKLGLKIIYTPKSVVTHHESVAPGRFLHNKHNADLYMSRWRDARSDEHGYYVEDGASWFGILLKDLQTMSYGPDEYHTRPLRITILRYFYLPTRKVLAALKFILSGDFAGLTKKIKGKTNASS